MFLLDNIGAGQFPLSPGDADIDLVDRIVEIARGFTKLLRSLPIFFNLEQAVKCGFTFDGRSQKDRSQSALRNTDSLFEQCLKVGTGLEAQMLPEKTGDLFAFVRYPFSKVWVKDVVSGSS